MNENYKKFFEFRRIMNENYKKFFEFVVNGNIDGVKKLLKEGVDINVQNKYGYREHFGYTGLLLATSYGRTEVVRLLVEMGADINFKNKDGDTALILAVVYRRNEIVSFLVENGADINVQNKIGNTALIIGSLKNGYTEIVRLLLEKGADINLQNKDGETALIRASMEARRETVRLLLEKGADINLQNKDGKTAIDLAGKTAIEIGKGPEIRKILLKAKEERNERSGQELAVAYEIKTGQSAKPGTGPAEQIKKFAGIQSPRGYKKTRNGGSRKRRATRRNRTRRL
jgi:ankyrin repeat protein